MLRIIFVLFFTFSLFANETIQMVSRTYKLESGEMQCQGIDVYPGKLFALGALFREYNDISSLQPLSNDRILSFIKLRLNPSFRGVYRVIYPEKCYSINEIEIISDLSGMLTSVSFPVGYYKNALERWQQKKTVPKPLTAEDIQNWRKNQSSKTVVKKREEIKKSDDLKIVPESLSIGDSSEPVQKDLSRRSLLGKSPLSAKEIQRCIDSKLNKLRKKHGNTISFSIERPEVCYSWDDIKVEKSNATLSTSRILKSPE